MADSGSLLGQQEQLRRWYLARLRKRALQLATGNSSFTPAGLIAADRDRLEELVQSRLSERRQIQHTISPRRSIPENLCRIAFGALIVSQVVVCIFLYSRHQLLAIACLCWFVLLSSIVYIYSVQINNRLAALRAELSSRAGLDSDLTTFDADSTMEKALTQALSNVARLEERQSLIADFSNEVVCLLNSDLTIKCVSPNCYALWGLTPVELTDRHIRELMAETDFASFKVCVESAQQHGGEFSVEVKLNLNAERRLDSLWTIEWSKSEQGFFALVQDVTAEKQIARLKDEFVAVVSHDLKSPISNVRWTLALVQDGLYGQLNEPGQERLASAIQAIDYLLSVIADLIDLHRFEISAAQLEFTEVSLPDLINESVQAVRVLAELKGIIVRFENSGGPLHARVDELRLKRVVINLLSNAIKFAPDNSVVDITLNTAAQEFHIAIKDHGPGIEAQYINTLFDRFCNIGNSDARRDGSGLGLFISKSIVKAHFGTINVTSSADKGTQFLISLPIGIREPG